MVGAAESGGGQTGASKKTDLLKPQKKAVVPKLKDLPDDAAERLLKSSGFPTASGKIAKAGDSGNTPVDKESIARLLADAEAEAEAQQGRGH